MANRTQPSSPGENRRPTDLVRRVACIVAVAMAINFCAFAIEYYALIATGQSIPRAETAGRPVIQDHSRFFLVSQSAYQIFEVHEIFTIVTFPVGLVAVFFLPFKTRKISWLDRWIRRGRWTVRGRGAS